MKQRSTLLSFAAVALTALLVGVGGAAHADNVVIDGDALTTNVSENSIALGSIACGSTASRTISVDVTKNGNNYPSTNVFQKGAVLTVTGSESHPDVEFAPAVEDAGEIAVPGNWDQVRNNTLSGDAAQATVVVTGSAEGSYSATLTVRATGAGSNGSTLTRTADPVTITWTVGACAPVKTATTTTVTCDGPTVFTGEAVEPCTAVATGANGFAQPVAVGYTPNVTVGGVTATAAYGGDATHLASTGSATFTITKAPSTTTVACPDRVTYTGLAQEPCTATVTGAGNLSQDLLASHSANTDVGTATATATFAGDANHEGSTDNETFEIAAASATCQVTGFAGEYDGGSHGAHGTCTGLRGVDLSDGLQLEGTFTDVPGGKLAWSFQYENYLPQGGTVDIAIGPAASSISLTCEDAVYDGEPHETCSAIVTGPGLWEELTVEYADNTNAGQATAVASYDGDLNHAPKTETRTFAIAKASSTTTISCEAVTYTGEPQKPCEATVTGAALSTTTPVDYAGDHTNAGPVDVAAGYPGDDNHEASSDTDTFVIAKASSTVEVTCTPGSVFTGSAIEPCTARVTGAGNLDENVTPVTYADNIGAGTASALATYAGDVNHTGSTGSATFQIDQADSVVEVTCPTDPIVFNGSAIEPCTARVTGAGNLDENVTPVTYADNTGAGTAHVSAAYPGDENHKSSTGSAEFEISKADSVVEVTCPTAPIVSTGSAIQPCTARVTGAGNLDEEVTPVTYTHNTAVGTAHAEATYPGDANHNGSTGWSTFTIVWSLNGFYKPVDMMVNGAEVVNVVKGGSTVPLKFNVFDGGAEVTSASTLGATFAVQSAACQAGAEYSDDLFVTTGNTALRYDTTAHQWIQNWQTPKTSGKCYRVRLTTADGSQLTALFRTK
ncbi:PxKF domain-containing protein [Microbacterium sp. NPDC019599]|uniref:PxKF domain-containing protein n=1 Tax=Microbacterium sp. NPDC019599 TaxID=3154690 RepID=UPI0033D29745